MNLEKNDIEMLEKFITLLYDKSSSTETVDAARKLLFMHKNIPFESLHVLRAVYQASIVWGQALEQQPVYLSPEKWGWKSNSDGNWDIHWTAISAISNVCSEFCKCACRKGCGAKCSCKKSNLQCTSICSCSCN